MGTKSFAAAAGAGLLTLMVAAPAAYHSRDLNYFTDDVYRISQEDDGPHMQVITSKMDTLADIPLTMNVDGQLTGHGIVKGDEFDVVVLDEEALFTHQHGAEKLWLGRDVVHVRPDMSIQPENTGPTFEEPGF